MTKLDKNEKIRHQGTVISFLKRKGYGFIRNQNNNKIFVHYSNIINQGYKTLEVGEEVEFSIKMTKLGMQAVEVVRLNPPPDTSEATLIKPKTW